MNNQSIDPDTDDCKAISQNYRQPVLDENFEQEGVVHGAFIDMIMNIAAKSSYLNEGHKGAQPAEWNKNTFQHLG